jgi:hypothetical protein
MMMTMMWVIAVGMLTCLGQVAQWRPVAVVPAAGRNETALWALSS